MHSESSRKTKGKLRRGLIQLEILVSTMLLGSILTCIVGLNYRLLGVIRDTKYYQAALHEAANQVQEITAGDFEGLDRRIAQAELPIDLGQVLPEGRLAVRRIDDQTGTKVLVRIDWNRSGMLNSVELVGWVSPQEYSQ